MKNKGNNDYLIHRILDKIEGSSVDWRKETSGNRSLKIQQEDFNRAGKSELLEEARMLEQRGVHYYWSWLPAKVGYDIYDEGAAVFSRAPITAAENLLLSKTNDYSNWKTRRTLGVCAGDVWYYTVHMGWWKDEEEPFAAQWETLSQAAGAKQTAFLLGDFNSEADVRGEGYDLILRSGWQDTYRLAQQRDDGYTVVQAIDGWRDAPDAAAKKRIDQIWCSRAAAIKSSRVVFNGLQEPQVSDHAGVLIEL